MDICPSGLVQFHGPSEGPYPEGKLRQRMHGGMCKIQCGSEMKGTW